MDNHYIVISRANTSLKNQTYLKTNEVHLIQYIKLQNYIFIKTGTKYTFLHPTKDLILKN